MNITRHKLLNKLARDSKLLDEALVRRKELEEHKINTLKKQNHEMSLLLSQVLEYLVEGFFKKKNSKNKDFMIEKIKGFYLSQRNLEFPLIYPSKNSVWCKENLADFIQELEG